MRKKELAAIVWERLLKKFPDAECSLESDSPERLAVRGILSAQCTDRVVNLTCEAFFKKYPEMEKIAELTEDEIGREIKACGLFRSKSKSVKAFASHFVNEWEHKVPNDVNILMEIPGVGKKIANLMIGEIYGIPAIVVDTHMKRVMKRIGLTDNSDPLKVEADLMKLFDESFWIRIGHLAVELGRTYCTASSPKCGDCPLADICKRRI